MHLAIRADGGADIGYGHLFRSGALAEECLASGHKVTVGTTTPRAARDIFPDAVQVFSLPSRGDPEPFVEWIDTANPDAVFSDAYPVDTEYQRQVRDKVPLAVLQDDARYPVCADLFVNGNLYADDLDYEFVGVEPKTRLGPEYVFLRGEIRDRVNRSPPWRDTPENAIATMGGSDISNLTPTVIEAFDGVDVVLDGIVGPGFSTVQERDVRDVARNVTTDVRVVRDPTDLIDRMFRADFAVSTASSTIYELLALGTPIVSIPVVDNQRPIADALRDQDIATVIEDEDADTRMIRQGIEAYVQDASLRKRRRRRGRELVDGFGTKRICEAIENLIQEQ